MNTAMNLGLVAAVAVLCGCASAPETQVASSAAATPAQQVCHRETPVGSNMAVTRCEAPQTASDHMDTVDALHKMTGPGAPGAGIGGK